MPISVELLRAIGRRDYTSANETLTAILNQKMAAQLAAERRTLGESLLVENATFKCQECGKKFNKPVDECPKCGGSDIDVLNEATVVKKALIRRPGYPVGQPAPLYLACVCGQELDMPDDGNATCPHCQRVYDSRGYIISEVTTGNKASLRRPAVLIPRPPRASMQTETAPPTNWRNGFQHPYQIGAGGHETPFLRNNTWYLRVWNTLERKHFLYNFSNDIFELDESVKLTEAAGVVSLADVKALAAIVQARIDAVRERQLDADSQRDYGWSAGKSQAERRAQLATVNQKTLRVTEKTKYILIDVMSTGSGSGKFMIDKTDGVIYGIKAYGVVHRGYRYGTVAAPDIKAMTAASVGYDSIYMHESLTFKDVQRIYDDTGDIPETELLCGVRKLRINEAGDVVSFVME